jgi:hypothetical protein
VFALAPFLGAESALFAEIERAGGLAQWRAPARAQPRASQYAPELWRWLQASIAGHERGPALYIGYGRADPLARTSGLLSAAMPREHVFVGPGGHNWVTWRRLFGEFLDRGPLREPCGAATPSAG